MGSVPTPRLIEAVAGLPEADRALLNLWVNRGLDDARLGALTGMDPRTVRMRRERIVTDLGAVLELSKGELLVALRTMSLPGTPEWSAALPAPEAEFASPTLDAEPASLTPEKEPAVAPRRHRRRWAAGAVTAVAAVIAALLVVLLSSSGSAPRAAAPDPPASDPGGTTAPGARPTTASTRSAAHPRTAPRPPPALSAFKSLPGGLVRASGHVTLLGHGHDLRLKLTVRHLPRLRRGAHYDAWLYTTVLDSRSLGRVRSGHTETYRLPSGARRYRFIDISLQPRGTVNHSGESRLRTVNPVRELRRHPRAARAHPRHALHPASFKRPKRTRGHHRARRHAAAHHAGHDHHAHRRGSDSRTRSTR